jgi:cell division protein FtsI (penicillin-binding protein 3)/stage V sporulation protein D (sporulation-specific penicillin-binding protein)
MNTLSPSSGRHRDIPTSGTRILVLAGFATVVMGIIICRLFQLQVLRYDQYSATAKDQHFGTITLPARRGEILVRDTHSGEFSKLATNTTLDLVYVDPLIAEDKIGIAKQLAPLLFSEKDYEHCTTDPRTCLYKVVPQEPEETEKPLSVPADSPFILDEKFKKEIEAEKPVKPYLTMLEEVTADIQNKISKLEVDFTILKRDVDADTLAEVVNARLDGIFIDEKKSFVYGDPTLIPEGKLAMTAQTLSPLLDIPSDELQKNLTRRKVRYVFLKNKIDPEVSRKIKELSLKGVVLVPEHWRYYPEESLASTIVGFLSREGLGQYGIEGYFNAELEGKKGTIYAESDPFGRQITVGEGKIVNAVNGDTLVLTIDRVIQQKVEEILAKDVEDFHADSGEVIVMNPFTGAILAMANYPSFNPNEYGDSYRLKKLEDPEKELYPTMPVFVRNEKGQYVNATKEEVENPMIDKFIFENKFGTAVFKNKVVSDLYEPGSVFKPLIMAIALDAKEVSPETTFLDDGPLHIDEFEIKNSLDRYFGKTTMTEVLEQSLNTGMAFVAKKLGKKLMYKYLNDFGFGQYTNITLEGEAKGRLDYYSKWSKAQLLTTAFGQGIVVTPLQMITAWSALANGGKLMQPTILDSVIRQDEVTKIEPKVVQRVISEETSSIITSMLISSVRNGVAKRAYIPGYLIAGKTGTSQIAGPNGKYETGEGSVITSFAGYAPALEPKFVILVKYDRPRLGESTWGESTAAPTFRRITEFLIDYYNIQPSY